MGTPLRSIQENSRIEQNFETILRIFLAILVIFLPPLLFEKYTFFLYATGSPNFFTYSGWRLFFDVIWFIGSGALSAIIVGRKKITANFAPTIAAVAFVVCVYAPPFCDPRECYVSSPDMLAPLRDFLFLGSLAILACNATLSIDIVKNWKMRSTEIYTFVVSAMLGFCLSFYPIIHIFAGVTVPYPSNYGQWFLGSAPSAFLAAFIATGRMKAPGKIRLKTRIFIFFAGISGLVLATALDLFLPCSACANYAPSIGSIILLGTLFSCLGQYLGEKIIATPEELASFGTRKKVASVGLTAAIIATAALLVFGFYYTASYEMSVVNNLGSPNTLYSPVEVGSTFVYGGGYLAIPTIRVPAVGVSVNFGNSSLPSDPSNFLAAGIGDQSPNCCKDGLDLSYRADAVLFSNGTEALLARTWWACDVNVACGGYSWQKLLYFNETILPKGTLSNWVDLQMNWTTGGKVQWFYSVDVGNLKSGWTLYSSFLPPAIDNHYFDSGLYYLGASNKPAPYAYFGQFGISSSVPAKSQDWHVLFACPKLFLNGTWTCYPQADFIQGSESLWKVLYTFGADYNGLSFSYLGNYTAMFYYSGESPASGTKIW